MTFKDPDNNKYTIEFKRPDARRHGWCAGYYYFPIDGQGTIQIDPGMSHQMILNTVVHEMAHAFFEDASETKTTNFANAVSGVLYNKLQFRSDDLQSIVR